jgi:hypothetical protein
MPRLYSDAFGACMRVYVWLCVPMCVSVCGCLCAGVMVLDDVSFVDGVASTEYTLIKFYAPFV